jgi:hypothetical protein
MLSHSTRPKSPHPAMVLERSFYETADLSLLSMLIFGAYMACRLARPFSRQRIALWPLSLPQYYYGSEFDDLAWIIVTDRQPQSDFPSCARQNAVFPRPSTFPARYFEATVLASAS